MKFYYPSSVKIEIKPTKKEEHFAFFYHEDFSPKTTPPEVIGNTVVALKAALPYLSKGLKITHGKTCIAIRGVMSRQKIGDFLLGEFMHWGTAGDVPLRRIFETASSTVALRAHQGTL